MLLRESMLVFPADPTDTLFQEFRIIELSEALLLNCTCCILLSVHSGENPGQPFEKWRILLDSVCSF